jgi:ABC-type multidrug transport system fused ATPase/permease subunit
LSDFMLRLLFLSRFAVDNREFSTQGMRLLMSRGQCITLKWQCQEVLKVTGALFFSLFQSETWSTSFLGLNLGLIWGTVSFLNRKTHSKALAGLFSGFSQKKTLALALVLAGALSGLEAAFLVLFRHGLVQGAWGVLPGLLVLAALRLPLQAWLAHVESSRARILARLARLTVLRMLRSHAVSCEYRDLNVTLRTTLATTLPRAVEGWLAGRQALGAALQLAILLPLAVWAAPTVAWVFIPMALPAYAMARWKNRVLRRNMSQLRQHSETVEKGQDSWIDGLESLMGNGQLGQAWGEDARQFARQAKAESQGRVAQQLFPAWLELFFFAALALIVWLTSAPIGSQAEDLVDLKEWVILGGALLLAYRPVRELGRSWSLWMSGRFLWQDLATKIAEWQSLPKRKPPGLTSASALIMQRVSFAYGGGRPVFQEHDLTLDMHGITGITGSNGAGKTTLLRLLAGLEQPDKGEILWPEALIRVGHVAYLPQRLWLPLNLAPRLQRLEARNRERFEALESLLGTSRLRQRPVFEAREISGGERQRLALLMTLMSDAPFLLLDEPTAFLPGAEREALLRELLKVWRRADGSGTAPRGLVVVAHEPFLPSLCDRLLTLDPSMSL